MSNGTQTSIGTVTSLWRYPVKSMMGEEINAAQVTDHGLVGDRAYALIDGSDGKIATAKNPKKWPTLFGYRAAVIEPLQSAKAPSVQITLPNGTHVTSEQNDHNAVLSKALNRKVTLAANERGQGAGVGSSLSASSTRTAEEYWPDMEGLEHRDAVTDFNLPVGTFFDCADILLLTTATLKRLCELYREGRFEVPRFRPNIVVEPAEGEEGFVENAWAGRTLDIGNDVRLNVTGPCGRCVMTTLAQGDLPKDDGILRTAVEQNQGNVGVYAAVVRGGTIRRGDWLRFSA